MIDMTELMRKAKTPHPGEILYNEYIAPRGMTVQSFARRAGMRMPVLTGLLGGIFRVDENTAEALAAGTGKSPQYWLDLQAEYDKEVE